MLSEFLGAQRETERRVRLGQEGTAPPLQEAVVAGWGLAAAAREKRRRRRGDVQGVDKEGKGRETEGWGWEAARGREAAVAGCTWEG